jgi:RsiW-degrading membrane proteinase PrsW (M82 family)
VAGADTGRAFMIGAYETVLGRVSGIGMMDPGIGDQHVAVCIVNDRLRFRCLSTNPVFVNSQPFTSGELLRGQDFMIGSCMWHIVEAQQHGAAHFLESLQQGIGKLAGTEKLEGFSLKQMFSEVFKKRTPEEVEIYLGAGTPYTTPSILQVQTGWPKPWLFLRVLAVVALSYIALVVIMDNFQNPKAIPGVMFMGALSVPLAVLVLFFELNVPRNVSFTKLLMLVAIAGALSILCALFGYDLPVMKELGISAAGIVEETAKIIAVVILVRGTKYKYILNGILIGAAVGAGFGVFETAGYALDQGLQANGIAGMKHIILLRAWLAPFMHVLWTAMAAGALWRVKGDQPLKAKMFVDKRFLQGFGMAVILHTLWDASFGITSEAVVYLKCILLGLLGWYVIFAMVQQGLRQVKQEQAHASQHGIRVAAA